MRHRPPDLKRRLDVSRASPLELRIRQAIEAIESEKSDERLSDAVMLMGLALERVSDFVDDTEARAITLDLDARKALR